MTDQSATRRDIGDVPGERTRCHHDVNINATAIAATLHCLTGCAVGEIAGLSIGAAMGLSNGLTIVISVVLAFFFGYTLSTLALLKSGLVLGTALSVVLAADTLSIATMEVADNATIALIPGAMNAGLDDVVFWLGMMIALTCAFIVAFPVNRYLLQRGKGHALTHGNHGTTTEWSVSDASSRRSRSPASSPYSSRSWWAGSSPPSPAALTERAEPQDRRRQSARRVEKCRRESSSVDEVTNRARLACAA